MSAQPTDPTIEPAAPPQPSQPATLAYPPVASGDGSSAVGSIVAGYEILGELGRGGMGVVYKARQVQLNRIVALKMILAAEHAGAAQTARFRSEAETLARLQHPNIVQIYEVAEHDAQPFFSMEYVDGGSLDRKLDGTPQPSRQAARLIETLARAVHAAHERGIVHRDLKPANILLASGGRKPPDASGDSIEASGGLRPPLAAPVPMIVDFGLAKQLGGTQAQTQTGTVLGTPSYMAPEQAGGKKGELGPATDTYALGAIFYELLTGRPPFRAETPLDTILQVASEEPVPPSRLQPRLPRDLETICLKCLQKDPRKRYARALDLAEDLRRFQEGRPIQARPAGAVERLLKWARRRPAVAALVLVTLLGFVGVTIALITVEQQRQMAADSNAEMYRVNQLLLTARAELEKANAATKQEADNALSAKAHAERNGYFSNIALAHQLYQGNSVARAREALDRCPEEFRNWEWRYLHRLCRSELQTYPGTRGMGLQLVALSPDGKQVIAASGERSGGKLLIWEAASGRTVHELPLPGGAFSLALSRDGKRVALALEGAVAVCELGAKPTVRLLGEPQGRYRGVVYTTDNRLLAGGYFTAAEERGQGGTGHIEVWDVEAGKKLHRLSGFHAAPEVILTYRTLAISPDGRHLAAAAFDTGARGSSEFRKVEQALPEPGRRTEDDKSKNEGPRKTKGGPPAPVEPQKPTPPGKPVQKAQPPAKDPPRPVPSHQGQLKVWNLAKGTEWILDNNINSLSDLAFSPDGRSLAWGNAAAVSLLDLDGSPTSSVLTGHQQGVHALAFSPDGQRLASGSEDTSIRIWDVKTGREQFALRGHGEPVLRVAFGRDGRQLVSAAGLVVGFAGEVKLWNATGGPEARTAFGPDGEISLCVALSSVAQQYVGLHGKLGEGIGPPKLELSSWSLDDHRLVWSRPFNVEEDAPLLGFSPDGTRLVGSSRKGIKILDARTGKVERFVPQERDQRARSGLPEPVAMSTDSRLLATAWVREEPRPGKPGPEQQPPKQELFVELWEADTGKPLGRLSTVLPPGDPGTTVVTALAFRPDGKQLATTVAILGGGLVKTLVLDGELQFWDIAARALTARHPTTHTLFGIAYSADGRLLAASGGTLSEGRAILCETAKGRELLKLRGHGKDVNAVAFSPDGSRLVTGAGDGTLIFWETATGQEVLTLRGHRRSVTTAAFSRDGRTLFSGTGFDLLEYMGAESASTGLRLPMEVKTWDAPR